MSSERHGDWKYFRRIDFDSAGRIDRYTIQFYRRRNADWYDEIRYDSHEIKRGRDIVAPHFHMKLQSEFKRHADVAIEEIKGLIDNQLEEVDRVLKR